MMFKRRLASAYVIIATLLAVLVAAEATARLLAPKLPEEWGKWPHPIIARKYHQMRALSRKHERVDVVFVGSSMAVNGIDPVSFTNRTGLASYNAAFPAASGRSIAAWTLNIVLPLTRPKVVVVGITSRDLNDNGSIQKKLYQELMHSPGYKQATSRLAGLERFLESHSYFLRYRRAFRRPNRLARTIGRAGRGAEASIRTSGKRVGKRWNAPYRASEEWVRAKRSITLNDFAIAGRELRALRGLHRRLAARDIRMVVISMPATRDYVRAHPGDEDMAEFRSALRTFGEKERVPLIDAERALPGTMGFGDPIHLDGQGRDALTRALADRWKELLAHERTSLRLKPRSRAEAR